MKDKKVLILVVVITVILLFTVGVTYAFLNYSQTGTSNSQLIVGDIYMHFKETNQLTIENAMPQNVYIINTSEESVNKCVNYLYTNYGSHWNDLEYEEATGVNSIYENIDAFFMASLPTYTYRQYCSNDSELNNKFLNDINNGLFSMNVLIYFEENDILINTIKDSPYFEFTIDGKNTYDKEDIWYEIVLSYGDNHQTRTERLRDDLLKFRLVEVVDGVEQVLFTNKSYNDLTSKRVWVDTIPKNTTSEVVHTYRLYMWISDDTIIGNTSEADYDMETWNNEVYASIKVNVTGDFNEKELAYEDMYDVTDASCFRTVVYTTYTHNSNITNEEVSACVSYLTSILGAEEEGNTVNIGETYESFCRGTGTVFDLTFQQLLDGDWFSEEDLTYFSENNIIIGKETVAITDYDASCGSDVIIPKTINDYNVTKIETKAFDDKQLTSVVIPDSVTLIRDYAFRNNQLTSVIIENGVKIINYEAFADNNLTAVTIPDSVTDLSCYAFDDMVQITKNDDLVCY